MKNNRKKKLINYSFQLKTAIPAVIISSLLFSVIIVMIVYIASMSRGGSLVQMTGELDRAVANEDNIVTSFKEYAKRVKDPIFILATEKIEQDHKQSIAIIKENIRTLKFYSEKNILLLAVSIAVMVLNAVLLFMYLIHSTHKAAGPVFVMNRYVRNLLEGVKPELRSLRKNDELKDFYDDFTRLVAKYRRKHVKEEKSPSKSGHVTDDEQKDNIALLRINKHE